MAIFGNIIVNTVVLASMYILASLGFAFIFNMLGVINMAHGAIYMTGAYVCYFLMTLLGLSNWVSMIIAVAILALFGILVDKVCFTPFQNDFNKVVMVCVALMTILQTAATILSGATVATIPSFATGSASFLGITISNEKIVTFAVGVVLLIIVLIIVNKTSFGSQMQAVSQDRKGAALQGINIKKVSVIVCALGFGLACVAGCMMGAYNSVETTMGDNMNIKILMLVMLAGAGSMNGVIITGTILAFLDSLFPVLIQGYASSAVATGIIVLLLLIKPKGFFGHEM